MANKPGWGTAVGWCFSWLPSKEESRRNKIAKLEKKRARILKKRSSQANCDKLIVIDRRLQSLRDQAVNQ